MVKTWPSSINRSKASLQTNAPQYPLDLGERCNVPDRVCVPANVASDGSDVYAIAFLFLVHHELHDPTLYRRQVGIGLHPGRA